MSVHSTAKHNPLPRRPRRLPGKLALAAGLGTSLAMAGGCGQQATEEYLGSALLALQGQAEVEVMTGGHTVVPALCFHGQTQGGQGLVGGPFDRSVLPQEALDLITLPPEFVPPPGPPLGVDPAPVDRRETHIVDVDSHGEFPAHFDVSVYAPPPDAVLAPPFEGEPRQVTGSVCAVSEGHAAVAQPVYRSGFKVCDAETCYERTFYATLDGGRVFVEGRTCPVDQSKPCDDILYGDETLQYETIAAGVVARAVNPVITYLAEPAPAGSYTAFRLGAAEGLSAGYHVFEPPEDPRAHWECIALAEAGALPEIRETYEPRMVEEYGPYATLQMFPLMSVGSSITYVPDDVYQGGLAIQAKHAMASCPMPESREIDPSTAFVHLSLQGAAPTP